MKKLLLPLATLAVAAGIVLGSCTPATAAAANATPAGAAPGRQPIMGEPYAGNPSREAALVSAEYERIYGVRAIASAARWSGVSVDQPYRLATGATYTLVLIARGKPYTVDDLLKLAPSTFVRQPDGSYLLSENIVVENGATLRLADPDGLTIHMKSNRDSFVSIVTEAGDLEIQGSSKAPVTLDSWDPQSGKPDLKTGDGRAYVRVEGGTATLTYADFRNLGFWSGGTGGLALTGTDLSPIDIVNQKGGAPTNAWDQKVAPSVFDNQLLPTGELPNTGAPSAGPTGTYSYVSALLRHVSVTGNAYGMFITSADGVNIRDTTVRRSLIDGIVLHRYVTNSTITATKSMDNAVDGIAMTRASTGIVLSQVIASGNGRNGITLDGSPLADGPNASGMPVTTYGNNSLSESTVTDNKRYGIEVLGGRNLSISGNTVNDDRMGIVVNDQANNVVVRNNRVANADQNGIAIFSQSTKVDVTDNVVTSADIGVYSRDSSATVARNRITNARNHAVTFVGASAGSAATDNTVSGHGPSAIDLARSSGARSAGNNTSGWTSTKPFLVTLRAIFQPLTVLWLVLLLIVLIAAVGGTRRRRRRSGPRHPYANRAPLSSFTRGVIDPKDLGLPLPVAQVYPSQLSGNSQPSGA